MGIAELVQKYKSDRAYYTSGNYVEAQLRSDFLDPFFELLGWDLHNKACKSRTEREVIIEESLHSSEYTKKPDYTFKLFSERRFFVEAKKPSINLFTSAAPSKQVRRYGFTANLRISVLSNFEDLIIYDTTIPVKETDSNAVARLKYFHYTDYESCFEEINRLIGKEAVYSGDFDKNWDAVVVNHDAIDDFFVKQIDGWRTLLGNEIIKHNSGIPSNEYLNDTVQSYINEILFLRVCEDRNIEDYQVLLKIANATNYEKLIEKFKKADALYNSGLFNHSEINSMILDFDSSFWTIIKELYYPESPYSFNVLPSDILGKIYESLITKQLVYANGLASLEDKPDMERDIVSTPTHIIKNILEKTIRPLVEHKTVEEILQMRFADIACGSGSFLLELFQFLNDVIVEKLLIKDKSHLIQLGIDDYKLPFQLKKDILKRCIFGVDKDFNAVEATKFDLLLKLLEDEDSFSLVGFSHILPDLKDNIFYGNSLIEPADVLLAEDKATINPFSFGNLKFDAIIGNPPYMMSEDMLRYYPLEVPIYKRKYKVAFKQFDKYFIFIERAYSLLKETGSLGYIIPSKFMKVGAAVKLREFLKDNRAVLSITSFGANQVFNNKTTYTCILILSKIRRENFYYDEVRNLISWKLSNKTSASVDNVETNTLDNECWVLCPYSLKKIYEKILYNSKPLQELVGEENIFNGIQTSANDVFVVKPIREDSKYYFFKNKGIEYKVEKAITKPYYKTVSGGDSLNTYRTFKPNVRVIFPYKKVRQGMRPIPLGTIKTDFPELYKYLLSFKDRLIHRDIKPAPTSPNEWHRYGRQQSLDACTVPQKIIVGVLSAGDKYAIDTNGTIISSGGTAGYCIINVPQDSKYSIYYIQAILNSKYLEWISSLNGEVFRGGFIARGTKVLKRLPIKQIDFSNREQLKIYNEIIDLQKHLISLGDRIAKTIEGDRNNITFKRIFDDNKKELDTRIAYLYDLGEDDTLVPSIKEQYAVY